MRAIELFAGAGGAALGLEAAGLEHAALCEWDADACATLRAAGLGPVVEGDVRDLDAIERVAGLSCDVLWSSFPCQAWSQAGARLGAEDPRNGWPWTVDAIDRFQPRWFLAENVKGLTLHRAGCVAQNGQALLFGERPELSCPGCYLERVILPQLRERFAFVGFWLLDAADYGVPQHRRRVMFWAGPAPLQQPKATHGPGRATPWVSMAVALQLTENRVIGGGANPRTAGEDTRSYRDLTDEPATTLMAKPSGTAGPWVVGNLRGRSGGSRMETHSIDEPSRTLRHGGGSSVPYLCSPAPTVTTTEVKGTRATAGNGWTFRGGPDRASDALAVLTGYAYRPAPTVTVSDGQGLGSKATRDAVEAQIGRRRLTVEECATLQDFPDGYPFQGTKTAQYRQIGNAVPPTLARVVAQAVVDAEGAA